MPAEKKVAFEPAALPQVTAVDGDATAWSGDLLMIGVFDDDLQVNGEAVAISSDALKAMDAAFDGALTEIVNAGDFKAKPGESAVLRVAKNARFVGLIGLGSHEKAKAVVDWGASVFQGVGNALASASKSNKAKKAALTFTRAPGDVDAAVGKVALGALLGGYESTRFKSKPKQSTLESVELLVGSNGGVKAAIERAVALARGVMLSRYLVEAPPNICTPTHLADAAAHIVAQHDDVLSLRVLEKRECEEMGMGCYLGVAEASGEPPKFIHITYTPKSGNVKRKVGVIGKGLTFDSGGYNLKAGPGSMIEMMKFDMGGAGAVLGAARVIGATQPSDIEVHFIVAACENMIDASGLRPGDVLTAMNGKTVEVNNTDAEGRLTLADALTYAQQKCGVQSVVDIATLTGACMIALGTNIAGMFTPNDNIASQLNTASRAAGEKVWRMPMEEPYWDMMKSLVADMKNTGGRPGGAITAALFLKQYVDTEKVEWAHLDVAGPVWDEKSGGATGYGVGTLAAWVEQFSTADSS